MAILCFYPPEIYDPFGPTYRSKPLPNFYDSSESLETLFVDSKKNKKMNSEPN